MLSFDKMSRLSFPYLIVREPNEPRMKVKIVSGLNISSNPLIANSNHQGRSLLHFLQSEKTIPDLQNNDSHIHDSIELESF